MQGKQVIRKFFRENGISHIFQLPGLHTLSLNAELFHDKTLKIITARHETNCAFMADGYARSSGKPAVLLVTPGPGLGNIVSGCMEAFSDDVPVLILHIDIDRRDLGKGILHEILMPEDMFRNFTKGMFAPDKPAFILQSLEEALATCTTGRPGPVLVTIPFSFLDKEVTVEKQHQIADIPISDQADMDLFVDKLGVILRNKEKPVIIGGKSLMNPACGDIIEDICSRNIPFLTSTSGKGIVSDRNRFSFGNMIARGTSRDILSEADIVIAAGTRLRDVDSKRRGIKLGNLVHIDIDSQWINKNYPVSASSTGNIEAALRAILEVIRDKTFTWDIARLKQYQDSERFLIKKSAPGYDLIDCIRNSIPDDTIVVCDLNIPSYWAEYYFPVYFQRTFLMPRGISTIFYSLSAAIGAKIARPDLPCFALCGDGSVLPQIAELATIVTNNIPVVMFIDNNSSYSILEDAMRKRYDIEGSMLLSNPDFVRLADSFGIKAKAIDNLDDLRKTLLQDIRWDEPYLIEYKDNVSSPPWSY
ncbi:MAG: thiamine pyrophosphate-binding protein [Syntrophorhabdaceae bacterium]